MRFQDQLQDEKKGLTFSKDNKALKTVTQCFQPRVGVKQVFSPCHLFHHIKMSQLKPHLQEV